VGWVGIKNTCFIVVYFSRQAVAHTHMQGPFFFWIFSWKIFFSFYHIFLLLWISFCVFFAASFLFYFIFYFSTACKQCRGMGGVWGVEKGVTQKGCERKNKNEKRHYSDCDVGEKKK